MLSQFDALKKIFREKYGNAPIDAAAFHRHYQWCDLKDCLGYCCHGGVTVEDVERPAIEQAVKDHAAFFSTHVPGLPQEPVTWSDNDESHGTEVKPFQYPDGMLPEGFSHRSCVFRDDRGACSLQMLSAELGHDSWWLKPIWCWLFPVALEKDNGETLITVPYAGPGADLTLTDSFNQTDKEYAEFTTATRCGRACSEGEGKPGYEILARELGKLSELLGRDLIAEIKAYVPERR